MSNVPFSHRTQSDFQTPHKLRAFRKCVTDLAINDFGYDQARLERKIEKFAESVTNFERKDEIVASMRERNEDFFPKFVEKETEVVLDIVRHITFEFEIGNSIKPTGEAIVKEFRERRLHLDNAVGWLKCIEQEFQYIAETLPGDKNRYCGVSEKAEDLVRMVKGVRRDANKYLRQYKQTRKK